MVWTTSSTRSALITPGCHLSNYGAWGGRRSSMPMIWKDAPQNGKMRFTLALLMTWSTACAEKMELPLVPMPGQSHPESRRRDCQMVRELYRYRESETQPAGSGGADSGTDSAISRH